MNIELILWLTIWFVLSEILFIIGIKWDSYAQDHWIQSKIVSFFLMGFFVAFQAVIVSGNGPMWEAHYINLLYEFLIIFGIVCFFALNKLIVNIIEKKPKKKKEDLK